MVWTHPWRDTAVVDELMKLVAEGHSYGTAARLLNNKFHTGFSRNACIGKAHRLGIAQPRSTVPHRSRAEKERMRKKRPPRAKSVLKSKLADLIGAEPFVPKREPHIPENERKSLLDLGDKDCRWPIGDGPYTFCARPKVSGCPYCLDHARIAYNFEGTQESNRRHKARAVKWVLESV